MIDGGANQCAVANVRKLRALISCAPVHITSSSLKMTQADSVYIIAKYDYKPQSEEELSLKKNERLILLDDSDGRSGWWKAINDANRAGFIPSNYVRKERLIDTLKRKLTPRSTSLATPDGVLVATSMTLTSPTSGKFSLDEAQQPRLNPSKAGAKPSTMAVVTYTYSASQPDEIPLQKGQSVVVLEKSDDGWWQGKLPSGAVGWFPSNYVTETLTSPQSAAVQSISRVNEWQQENIKCKANSDPIEEENEDDVYLPHVAIYSFDAETPEELSIAKGDKLEVLQQSTADEHEWVFARNASGESGLVPAVYVRQIETESPMERTNNSTWSAPPKSSVQLLSSQNLKPKEKLPPPRPPMPHLVQKNSIGRESPTAEIMFDSNNSRITPAAAKRKCGGVLAKEAWYYGRVTRDESDSLLTNFGCEGDFLIRDSESNPGDFSVSMKARDKNKHFWVRVQSDGTYGIGTRRFGNLEELIAHYKSSPIYSNDKGEKLFLKAALPVN